VDSYWGRSRRPLTVLAFLLPLVLAYEAGLAFLLSDPERNTVITVEAHQRLLAFFSWFGIDAKGGLLLGGVAILVVLLVWHVLERHPWRVAWRDLPLMGLESIILVLPLLGIAKVAGGAMDAATALSVAGAGSDTVGAGTAGAEAFQTMDLAGRLTISIGAGLYEELLFRMVLIAAIHALIVDLVKGPGWLGWLVGIIISAAAFTVYHDLHGAHGALVMTRVTFFAAAGLYLGVLYAARGFGIVVAAHALYDIAVAVMVEPA
jgi:membrane protease YdiL (CAAX protease family)